MRGLRFHLFLQLFLPLALLAALLVWLTFTMVERLVEARLENEIELVARSISRPVQEALNAGALDRMRESLTSIFEIGGVYGAYVYDSDGRRVVSAGEVMPGRRQQIQAAELVEVGEQRGQYEAVAGEEVYSYFVPLTDAGGRIQGLLQLTRAESEIALQLNRVRVWGWLLLAGVLGIMLLILFFGHRRAVGRHVEGLMASMARIENGERDHRADVRGPRELAALAAGLNRMLDGLARMERELADQRREQVRMAERMRDQEKYAALGRFSSGVAHELGAPLSVIDGDARRLDGEVDPEDRGRRLARIRKQVDRTRRLLNQLMNFVRADHRTGEPVRVREIMRQAAAGVQPEADAREVDFNVVLPDGDPVVRGHAIRLEHALVNLLRNALQATPGGVVKLSTAVREDYLALIVDDDGPGVPEDQRRRIFEPFHTTREMGEGTGLGLAIVRSVAEEHAGKIRLLTGLQGGSRFELCLPREAI